MKAANIYLNFVDTAEEAFAFYRSVFGGEFTAKMRFRDAPPDARSADVPPPTPQDLDRILHISLPLPNGTVLMASDCPASMGRRPTVGDNVTISIETDSEAETTRLFDALSAGGTAVMPPGRTFWNAFFGMCVDRFGVQWMVNYSYGPSKG